MERARAKQRTTESPLVAHDRSSATLLDNRTMVFRNERNASDVSSKHSCAIGTLPTGSPFPHGNEQERNAPELLLPLSQTYRLPTYCCGVVESRLART